MKAGDVTQGGLGRGMGRGADPEDAAAFRADAVPRLQEAVVDLSWLLGRGYAESAAVALVGDRYQLTGRQRMAIRRCAASDDAVRDRLSRRRPPGPGDLLVDGFNVLITLERAVGGGAVLIGREGAARDLAGVHGTWRRGAQTAAALGHVGEALPAGARLRWLLDRPVSNSGRLAGLIAELAASRGWAWEVEVTEQVDRALLAAGGCVATSDAGVLDRCGPWVSLAGEVIARRLPDAWLVDLGRARHRLALSARDPAAP